ncbi:MFS general substrate transporter [Paraphaeosphaeria sporulosa]|uniref:MFS general substrate transporter n=1 Tax=Paraphaeosphaeria sporulosa TaxID=1460663 RepID=A0A177CIH1_9PLEO|nr:MFS general substrate transporter [Paraphaeosphaeria sporulosa]OAG06772.1 MFS general substrate transporter [Paraphaeosphaeria sporulosa]
MSSNATNEKLAPSQDHIERYEDHPGMGHRRSSSIAVDAFGHRDIDDRAEEAKGRMSDVIDPKYWYSWRFLGSMFAVGMAFMGGIGGIALISPILANINEDIGPSPNINWVPLVNLCGGAVFFLLVGSLSDIFGRRWFFIIGSVISLIGSIIGACAQNVNTLIGAEVFIGIGVAFQQSFFWVVAELVPMKWRYIANSFCYAMTTPTSPLAARVAYSFLEYPGGWRNCFYLLIAINATSVLAWYIFYHPPTFSMLHRKALAKDLFFSFDWIGVMLFTGGLCILIFGLNWGGVLYPWKSAAVIATMAVGGSTLFFVLPAYEIFIHKKGRSTYLPLHLFKNIRFQSAAWNTGIAAGVYYGFGIVFPQIVQTVYYGRGEISRYDIGTLAGLVPMCFVFAQMCHGFVVWFTGPKWGMIGGAVIGCALLTAASANLNNRALTQGLIIPGAFAIGIVESVSITTSTFPLRSQEEIGQGGGLSGSTRNFVSAIAVAIYQSTLSNRLLTTIPQHVYPVARSLGLPDGSLDNLRMALQGQGSFDAVQGLTPQIQAAVMEPYRQAFVSAGQTVFLVSLAFSGSALILSFFTTENDESTANFVATQSGIQRTQESKEEIASS